MAGNPQNQATAQLSALPFGHLIGGPLVAAVEAQAKSAQVSYEYIRAVGFVENDQGEITGTRDVTFKYQKKNESGTGTRNVTLTVPIITVLPIPYIRIEEMNINFKAQINAETEMVSSSSFSLGSTTEGSASYRSFWGLKANFKASVSSKYDSKASRDSRYSVEYTMDINVKAVQDDMPGGMAKVLSILEEAIKEQPQ